MMTNKELREWLSEFDDNATVLIESCNIKNRPISGLGSTFPEAHTLFIHFPTYDDDEMNYEPVDGNNSSLFQAEISESTLNLFKGEND
jgi:hypothetical protein